jgi:3-phytase
VGRFTVPDGAIHGSQQCDGAHVVSADLGEGFNAGLLVVHDGRNTPEVMTPDGAVRQNTNFKYVRWTDVAKTLGLAVGRE